MTIQDGNVLSAGIAVFQTGRCVSEGSGPRCLPCADFALPKAKGWAWCLVRGVLRKRGAKGACCLVRLEKLQTKISKYFAIIIVCLVIIMSAVLGLYSSHKLQTETGDGLANAAGQVSMQLDQFMWTHYHQLDLLEEANELVSDGDYGVSSALIEKLRDSFPSFSWVGITDANGVVRASSDNILLNADISERPVFTEGAKGEFIGDVHDAKLLSDLLPNPTGEPLRFVDISLALYDEQANFSGVLAAHLNWDWAQSRIASTAKTFNGAQQIEVLVLSKNYDVLLGPEDHIGESMAPAFSEAKLGAGSNWSVMQWPDGEQYLTGFVTSTGYDDYSGLGWVVAVRQPVMIAYESIAQLLTLVVACGAVLLVVFLLLSAVLSRKLSEPLNRLSEVAVLLKLGRKDSMPDCNGIYELENLKAALSNLFSDLNTTDAALDKMKAIATTDPLTGLQNRRSCESFLDECEKSLDRSESSLVIMYFDLDGFKGINDRFGHDVGDEILIGVAQRLAGDVRSNEMLFRIGGDEFLMGLVVPAKTAASVVEGISRRIIDDVNRPFPFDGCEVRVGCSIGVSVYPEDSANIHTVVKYADKALYHAKSNGKNHCTVYSDIG